MNKKLSWMFGCALALGSLRMLVACDDDPVTATTDAGKDAAADAAPDGSTSQKLSGKISYAGSKTGLALYVAVIEDKEGKGNPPLTAALIGSKRLAATFPATYEITQVPPGDYAVFVYLSTKTDHVQGPVVEDDPQGYAPVKIVLGTANTVVDIELQDPPPPALDGGSDSGPADASDSG